MENFFWVIMYEIKERFTTNNEESKSRYKDFIGLLMNDS